MLVALASLALACGPSDAQTLAAQGTYRVYRQNGVVHGCHGARRTRLGTRVLEVRLAGRTAVVRSRTARFQRLRAVDLRDGTRSEAVDADRFLAVRADGLVAYVAETGGRRSVGALDQLWAGVQSAAIEPETLRLAGGMLAWREGRTLRLQFFENRRAKGTPLARLAAFRFTVRGEDVYANHAGGPPRAIGRPIDPCASASGCGGFEAVQAAGAFLAARETNIDPFGGTGFVRVFDFATGARRDVCRAEAVGAFVITETGGVACATIHGALRRIETPAAVLDEGLGIDPRSLVRRGDRIVWLHDGVERSATAFG